MATAAAASSPPKEEEDEDEPIATKPPPEEREPTPPLPPKKDNAERHRPLKKRGARWKGAAAAGVTSTGLDEPLPDIPWPPHRQGDADATKKSPPPPPPPVKMQPWASVKLSDKAQWALRDWQADWDGWVAPFTSSGKALREKRRREEDGGDESAVTDVAEDSRPPKKKLATAIALVEKHWYTPVFEVPLHIHILPSTPPRQLLDAILATRGYVTRTCSALPTNRTAPQTTHQANKPSALRVASYGPAVLSAVQNSDPCLLSSLLLSGLHPNPCDASGWDTLLSRICASRDVALYWVLTEAYGADPLEVGPQGRTALHHLCAAQHIRTSEVDGGTTGLWPMVWMMLKNDVRALRITDAEGKTPLDLLDPAAWGTWNWFLQCSVDRYWPRRQDNNYYQLRRDEEDLEKFAASLSVPRPDPPGALPLEVARAVAAGAIQPDEVDQARRAVAARLQAAQAAMKPPAVAVVATPVAPGAIAAAPAAAALAKRSTPPAVGAAAGVAKHDAFETSPPTKRLRTNLEQRKYTSRTA